MKYDRLTPWISTATALLAFGIVAYAHAQSNEDYPVRPIRVISPFTPGGGNDVVARIVSLAIAKNIGQSVVVDNRPGGNSIVGMELVATAAPNGLAGSEAVRRDEKSPLSVAWVGK